MSSCLGIYVGENIIKYAKVQKDKDSFKVEAFGVKFYEKLDEVLKQIIKETYSNKTRISINISNEMYNYFDIYAMLSKQDIKKSVDIEYDMFAEKNGIDKTKIESRYMLIPNVNEKEKLKAINISIQKNDLTKQLNNFNEYKATTAIPTSIAITNLIKDLKQEENCLVVNIEDNTTATAIIGGKITSVDVIKDGMKNIFNEINKKENSMSKTFEICKNTTIYTQVSQNLQTDDNEYLEDIMPTLYKIATAVKNVVDSSVTPISKVYITGSGTAINNIDIYFQEYISSAKCEILKPFFIEASSIKISVKDYIEVNSAIALALEGIEGKNKELNFSNKVGIDVNKDVKFTLKGEIDKIEKLLIRIAIICVIAIGGYTIITNQLVKNINDKSEEARIQLIKENEEISKIEYDINKINSQSETYSRLISNFENKNAESKMKYLAKDAIPNFLNKIMTLIPQQVQLTLVENTSEKHIVIEAQSTKYEQLGIFKAVLVENNVLKNVKSTSGVKEDSVVKVTIEGDLP